MNPEAKEYLDKILAKTIEELRDDEKRFLRARSSYLTKAQLGEYDSIINPEPAPLYIAKKYRNQTSDQETVKTNGKKE